MFKATENGSCSVPPFLRKCYEMVDDGATDSVISWSYNSNSFVIWDLTEFTVNLLPKYFKHNNFSSFIRQLNIYGFRKINTDRWEFSNDGFIRGQKNLLKNISRRKHPQVADQQKAPQQLDNLEPLEVATIDLWKEVGNLKTDKNALSQELVKLQQHQESSENKLLLLRDRLQGMEKNQQQMLSFLVMAMQCPGFFVQLLQPKENWRIADMLEQSEQNDGPVASDGMIVTYKPPVCEKLKPLVTPSSGAEKKTESNPSEYGMKDFFVNSDFLKVLMDEKLCSLENHSPFILPDVPDDGTWEQFLLSSPLRENAEDAKLENEGAAENVSEYLENSQNFDFIFAQLEKSQTPGVESVISEAHHEKLQTQSMEYLTSQMELLASEPNSNKGPN